MRPPDTRFTWNDGFALAYQVVGRGDEDLVYLPGRVSNVDLQWQVPSYALFLEDLASFSRLIVLDRRGVGCSDRLSPGTAASLEQITDDVLAVMEAASCDAATIFGVQDTVFLALWLAASRPYAVRRLVLFGASPAWLRSDELPDEWPSDRWESQLRAGERTTSGSDDVDALIRQALPSLSRDERTRRAVVSLFLNNQGPGSSLAENRMLSRIDLREILPTLDVPTLVLHRRDDALVPPSSSRFLAEHIPGAQRVELPGKDALPWVGDSRSVVEAIEGFMGVEPPSPVTDRRLATVLFTDIVGSSERAAKVGDAVWSRLLTDHHRAVREQLSAHGGSEIDTAGDGFFATFERPAHGLRCAIAISRAVQGLGLEIRAGVHAGEVETIDGKVGGIAAVIGARVCSLGGPGEVLVTQTVKDLTAGSQVVFEDAGEHELKGVPGRWHLYRIGARSRAVRRLARTWPGAKGW